MANKYSHNVYSLCKRRNASNECDDMSCCFGCDTPTIDIEEIVRWMNQWKDKCSDLEDQLTAAKERIKTLEVKVK